jgi:prepilin-type N-terminal cleavage/methylation domain-containing protein
MRAARARRQRGITLIEMMVVLVLIALLAGVSAPSVSRGLDAVRLRSAADATASFLSYGLTWCERRQQTVFLIVPEERNRLELRPLEGPRLRELELTDGIVVSSVLPELATEERRRVIPLQAGAPFPGITIELKDGRGGRRWVRIDPVNGVPEVVIPADKNDDEKK